VRLFSAIIGTAPSGFRADPGNTSPAYPASRIPRQISGNKVNQLATIESLQTGPLKILSFLPINTYDDLGLVCITPAVNFVDL
jgi:hypothetical protein